MNVLVIDVGGHHIKFLATGQDEKREFESGPKMTAQEMIDGVRARTSDWSFEAISIGYPGFVVRGRPVTEPTNLGCDWVGFDFEGSFGHPVKIVNDAAMQALGSYKDGRMLFLGLGTGLGAAMVVDGVVEPMELAHLRYRKATFEDYVGTKGLERLGKKRWRRRVLDVIDRLTTAMEPDDVVIGGGNVKKLKELPPGCREGDNANAFAGGFRLWSDDSIQTRAHPTHNAGKKATDDTPEGTPTDDGNQLSVDQPSGVEGA